MRVAFRTDASEVIGSGHVMRCMTLAKKFLDRGARVLFVSRKHGGHLCDWIAAQGMAVAPLPVTGITSKLLPNHGHWLGTDSWSDAEATGEALHGVGFAGADWVIVDHYALDAKWEQRLKTHASRIMAIDDLADRQHDCDILLDQNLVAQHETRYDAYTPARTVKLLGPRYALLHSDYADLHLLCRKRTGPPRQLIVYFGGTDATNLTGMTLAAFLALKRDDVRMDLVIGLANPHKDAIIAQARGRSNIAVHHHVPSLAPLMAQADLAVGASGATSWERLCLKLPSIVVTLAANQRPIAAELHRRRLICWIGDAEEVTSQRMKATLDAWLNGHANGRCELTDFEIDGMGTERVFRTLQAISTASQGAS